jgi:signal transduction histidine kinase
MHAPNDGLPAPATVPTAAPRFAQSSRPEEISGASQRLRALAALSGSLTDALEPAEAANLVEEKALSALGATSAVVVTLGPFPPRVPPNVGTYAAPPPTALHVVHAIGLPDEVSAALDQAPLDSPVPFAQVARDGQPLFLGTEERLRSSGDWGVAMIAAGARAAAIVPVWANGELRGVLGLSWPEPHTFDTDEQAFVLTLGVMCAQAIMRAHLKGAEHDARASAEAANRSKAHFVATISHELRTPMNAVLGYTELMSEEVYGPVSALQRDHLDRVRASGKHLMGLIEDLLGYARVEAGVETVKPEPLVLVDVVKASLVLVQPLADQKGLRIRLEAPEKPVELFTDARKLRQILVNLLANAVKFADDGDVVLVLRGEGVEPDVRIHFEVTDHGRGIATADQEHIFDPFSRSDADVSPAAGSTGLGLTVARKLAQLLGGDLTLLRSAPGQGSTFIVSLPARFAPATKH